MYMEMILIELNRFKSIPLIEKIILRVVASKGISEKRKTAS